MKIKPRIQTDDAQVQIIPLIDVIFCILTFFILAALQFSRQEVVKSINLELPRSNMGTQSAQNPQAGGSQAPRQNFIVYIDGLGQTFIQNQPNPVPKEQLRGILANYLQQNPTGTLVLNANRSASYNDFIQTIDLLREVGGDRVSLGLSTDSIEQPPGSTIPAVPGTGTLPNNPQGNLNPAIPPATNQAPFPNIPAPGVNPANPGQLNTPAQTLPVVPGSTKSTP
jgi:biopolymer transport protein ExbD